MRREKTGAVRAVMKMNTKGKEKWKTKKEMAGYS